MIHLRKVDASNFWDIVDLKVTESQKEYVAPNDISIAQVYTTIGTGCSAFPFGIYNDETPVGFLLIAFHMPALYEAEGETPPEIVKNNYSLWRLMIDEKYQNKGYGREAVRLALAFIQTWPCGQADYCELSYEPENQVARKLCHSFGFTETGEVEDGEIVAVLKL